MIGGSLNGQVGYLGPPQGQKEVDLKLREFDGEGRSLLPRHLRPPVLQDEGLALDLPVLP